MLMLEFRKKHLRKPQLRSPPHLRMRRLMPLLRINRLLTKSSEVDGLTLSHRNLVNASGCGGFVVLGVRLRGG